MYVEPERIRTRIGQIGPSGGLGRQLLGRLYTKLDRGRWSRPLWHKRLRCWHRRHWRHRRHRWNRRRTLCLSKPGHSRLNCRWQKSVDACSLWIQRTRRKGIESCRLGLHGLERRSRRVGEWAPILLKALLLHAWLETLLHARLQVRLEARLHETRRLGLLE